ncbi:protein RIC-3b [Neoarius graeffei]|uniref:protein RIC-3b n=1 Tax=Neoarius graeffei TaxID=443677 RepID=UPI00298C4E1D|nr:protein RIC-3b [Neoarius graeffei]
MSTFQKVAVVSCVCVCVALLLPKLLLSGGGGGGGRRDSAEEARFPPVLQRKSVPSPPRGAGGNSAHHPEAIARAKGSTTAAGKSNLAGQIIPVYGFGILLYIFYIIFKITSRGKTGKSHESRFPAARSENMKRKITDFELMQLQERLKETEEVMERIVSRAQAQSGNTLREECVSVDQEEKLLLQLRVITRVMQEGRLVDRIPSGTETLDPECDQEFTDDPEEMLKPWSSHCCTVHHQTAEEETERADRQTAEEETERADRQTAEEETERADRQTAEEEKERADRQIGEEETARADRQTDSCEKNECSDAGGDGEEELCTEVMEQSEAQPWNTSLSGGRVIRCRRGTTRGTEPSH